MKIAINTRWLLPNKLEGFGWYTFHILSRIADLMPEVDFIGIGDRKIEDHLVEKINVDFISIRPPARHPILWTLWNQVSIPIALKQTKADLYFSPDGFLPYNLSIPTLVTIHDLNFEEREHYINSNVERYYRKHIRKSANCASHILTVSDYSKDDIENRYGIAKNKLTRVYCASQKEFLDLHKKAISTQQRYAHGHPFFLFVGAQNPRKNLHRIFKAFDGFVSKCQTDHRLVLVGEKMMWNEEIELTWKNMVHQDRVYFTGRLNEDDLNQAYSAATALLYPSIFEGFGIPIVEAFASGTPVITSLSTSMPEVAGDAALLVDPTSTDEIVSAMERIVFEEGVAESLKEKGFRRSILFNWDTAAEKTVQVLKSMLHA